MLRLRTACYWPVASQQAGAVHHGPGTSAILIVRRFVIKSLLFTCKTVSGSVRVRVRVRARARARARVSARVTVRDRDRI